MNVYMLDSRYQIEIDFEGALVEENPPLKLIDAVTGGIIYQVRDQAGFKKKFSNISLEHAKKGLYKFYRLIREKGCVYRPVAITYGALSRLNQRMVADRDLIARFKKEVTHNELDSSADTNNEVLSAI